MCGPRPPTLTSPSAASAKTLVGMPGLPPMRPAHLRPRTRADLLSSPDVFVASCKLVPTEEALFFWGMPPADMTCYSSDLGSSMQVL